VADGRILRASETKNKDLFFVRIHGSPLLVINWLDVPANCPNRASAVRGPASASSPNS
jgi:hypothetical protein